jgi:arylsulfatase
MACITEGATGCPWYSANIPFRRWNRETYRASISDPFVVRYPNGIEVEGEERMQYSPPFELTGTIDSVIVDVGGALIGDTEHRVRVIVARQSDWRASSIAHQTGLVVWR